MTLDTTMMAYSMTKTLTAVAALQLVETGQLDLDGGLDDYLPETPYAGSGVTIRHLLNHTSGIPNPIPLRWIHLIEDHTSFDEDAALTNVLTRHTRLRFDPGAKFAYSNIGYWLVGKIIERLTSHTYSDYVTTQILEPLEAPPGEMGFVIADPQRHAAGYLARSSPMNWAKRFLMDPAFWEGYDDNWLRFRNHYLNGPAFGGLIGTARGFARFLQDQLSKESVLLTDNARNLLSEPQTDHDGGTIPMTLGWHIGTQQGTTYRFKEGGGGGFHSEMRLYPGVGIGSVVMVNSTTFKSSPYLDDADSAFLLERPST